jgi:hypothetical protein
MREGRQSAAEDKDQYESIQTLLRSQVFEIFNKPSSERNCWCATLSRLSMMRTKTPLISSHISLLEPTRKHQHAQPIRSSFTALL